MVLKLILFIWHTYAAQTIIACNTRKWRGCRSQLWGQPYPFLPMWRPESFECNTRPGGMLYASESTST